MSDTGFDWESDGCDATFGERVQNYKRQGFGSQASEDLATEEMLTEIHAMVRFLALSSLRASLSTDREEERREGMEEAAKVAEERFTHDSVVKSKKGKPYITGSAAIYASGQIAAAIRAKIEETRALNTSQERVKEIEKTEHEGEYVEAGHMIDKWRCSCGWESKPYFDGAEYAKQEWEGHVRAEQRRALEADG